MLLEKRSLKSCPTSVVMAGMLVLYSERRVHGASVNEEEVRREELEYATLMVLCPPEKQNSRLHGEGQTYFRYLDLLAYSPTRLC